jgi:hypothetical protein
MSDDRKPEGLALPPPISGFDQEPGETRPAANGHAAAPAPAETPRDPLHVILTTEVFPEALRVIADRLLKAEHAFNQLQHQIHDRPDEFLVAEALAQFRGEIQAQTEVVQNSAKAVVHLGQQRSMAELQMERQTRGAALDLAIKALPEKDREADTIVTYAEAFLAWLKGGMQA